MDQEHRALGFEPVVVLGIDPIIAALVSHGMAKLPEFEESLNLDHLVDLTNILLAKLENEHRADEAARAAGGSR